MNRDVLYRCKCGQALYKGQKKCPSCKEDINPALYEEISNELISELDDAETLLDFLRILKKRGVNGVVVLKDNQSGREEVFDLSQIDDDDLDFPPFYPSYPTLAFGHALVVLIIAVIAVLILKYMHLLPFLQH